MKGVTSQKIQLQRYIIIPFERSDGVRHVVDG